MKHKSTKFTLLQYSLLSTGLILKYSDLDAIAVYTDINPDAVFDADLEGMFLDMDNNGVPDFAFLNVSYTWSDVGHSFRQRIFVGPYLSANEIEGLWSGWSFPWPYALSEGELVSESDHFEYLSFQEMAFRTYWSGTTYWGSIVYGTWAGAHWYPESLDHYLGVKFIDESMQTHYGWIRCDVKDEGRTLVVKDYAYEKMPNTAIKAGDTVGKIPVLATDSLMHHYTDVPTINTLSATIYTYHKNLYIILTSDDQTQILLSNMEGKTVLQQELFDIKTTINLSNLPDGLYIVNLFANNEHYTKEVLFTE